MGCFQILYSIGLEPPRSPKERWKKVFYKESDKTHTFLVQCAGLLIFRAHAPKPRTASNSEKKGCRSQCNTWTLATSHHGCNPWLWAATKYRNWDTIMFIRGSNILNLQNTPIGHHPKKPDWGRKVSKCLKKDSCHASTKAVSYALEFTDPNELGNAFCLRRPSVCSGVWFVVSEYQICVLWEYMGTPFEHHILI